ncbi:hypothetical protein ACFLIM_49010 [Nonomuraea sp. M3C6]|uniref:Uncharacterized protein n=1 Tax=Nonomuraea marmarensis TaxID=3351344 RepID=A0ABW7AUQ5_9ACTN
MADDDQADAMLGFGCAEAAMRGLPLLVIHAWQRLRRPGEGRSRHSTR